jgi:hypothetical protein
MLHPNPTIKPNYGDYHKYPLSLLNTVFLLSNCLFRLEDLQINTIVFIRRISPIPDIRRSSLFHCLAMSAIFCINYVARCIEHPPSILEYNYPPQYIPYYNTEGFFKSFQVSSLPGSPCCHIKPTSLALLSIIL